MVRVCWLSYLSQTDPKLHKKKRSFGGGGKCFGANTRDYEERGYWGDGGHEGVGLLQTHLGYFREGQQEKMKKRMEETGCYYCEMFRNVQK